MSENDTDEPEIFKKCLKSEGIGERERGGGSHDSRTPRWPRFSAIGGKRERETERKGKGEREREREIQGFWIFVFCHVGYILQPREHALVLNAAQCWGNDGCNEGGLRWSNKGLKDGKTHKHTQAAWYSSSRYSVNMKICSCYFVSQICCRFHSEKTKFHQSLSSHMLCIIVQTFIEVVTYISCCVIGQSFHSQTFTL